MEASHSSYISINPSDLNAIYSLRYSVFIKRLNWALTENAGLESDDYDTPDASYLYIKNETQSLIGCWRIIPTTKRYMLKDTFPELLAGSEAPCDRRIHELSRFAVEKNTDRSGVGVSNVTMKMFQAIYLYAIENDISEYVTVTSTAVERIIRKVGIPFERMGDGNARILGDTKSVALRIQNNDVFRNAVMN